MEAVLSAKLTKGGQVTLPKVIRELLGIEDGSRVYWVTEGDRAYISTTPVQPPLAIHSVAEFWDGIAQAQEDVSAGRVRNAQAASQSVRERYGL